MRLFGVRDNVAQAIVGGLHLFAHDAVAVRFFRDIAGDPLTNVFRHLADHDLVAVALFDPETCLVVGLGVPEVVISGVALEASRPSLEV